MNKVALNQAKNKLTQIVRSVEEGEPVELTRHGKPVAVLMGSTLYKKITDKTASFSHSYNQFITEWPVGQAEAEREGEDPFRNLRSRDSGRPVAL